MGTVHSPDLVAQLDGVADDVSRKWKGCLERKIESESQGGPRAADVLQGLVGRGRQNEDGVPWGRREVPVWCRKLDTRTSRYESSVAMCASRRGLRDATAAQVADGSDRSTGDARAGRV